MKFTVTLTQLLWAFLSCRVLRIVVAFHGSTANHGRQRDTKTNMQFYSPPIKCMENPASHSIQQQQQLQRRKKYGMDFSDYCHRKSIFLMALSSSSSSTSTTTTAVSDLVSGDVPWTALVGEADRAFRMAVQLEKNGQARKASAAFHEAATLYQCFLDSPKEFSHVTSLPSKDDCIMVLAYACLRLGFLNYDALGDPMAASRLYQEATRLDPYPSAVSYDGMGQALEAASAGRALPEAIAAYQKARDVKPQNKHVLFHLAVAMERMGQETEANELFDILRRDEADFSCLVDSWGYVRWHTRRVPSEQLNLYHGTRNMLSIAIQAAMPLIEQGGKICEFGVGSGRSLRMTLELLPLNVQTSGVVHGFDSFTGLPQAWGREPAGSYSTGGRIPNIPGGLVTFHKGWFRETIGPFFEQQQRQVDQDATVFLAYANIDCDLYSSTLDVLESLHGHIVPGTILVFDEYIGHATWRQDEFRAWRECCKRFGWKYEYLVFSLSTKQAVVRITYA